MIILIVVLAGNIKKNTLAVLLLALLRKVNNKLVSLYQLSQIPHGKNCEIRGGRSSFQGNITFGDHVVIGTDSNYMSTGAKIEIGNPVLFGSHVFIITGKPSGKSDW